MPAQPPEHPESPPRKSMLPHPIEIWRPSVAFWRSLPETTVTAKERDRMLALENRLRGTSGNALRAAVLGVNDGLVTNLSLVMGVLGANVSGRGVLVTGFAGLLAGAFSMALGEWLSVQNSRELRQRQLRLEALQILQYPDEERHELIEIYQAKGLPRQEAETVAERIMRDKSAALDTMAREEFGMDPADLSGSPYQAAGLSLLMFALGAFIPLIGFLFLRGGAAIATSLVISGLALLVSGAAAAQLTGQNPFLSGVRQLLFGAGAAALTFAIVHAFKAPLIS